MRHIHVVLPIVVFSTAYFLTNYLQSNLKVISVNVLFFCITIALLTLYMSLKNKGFLNPFQNYFGLGDLLFYIAITPLFLLYNYVLFFITSLLFSIVMQFVLLKWIKKDSVPLAGLSALLLLFVIAKDVVFSVQKITLIR
ncbi:hypothetical protein FIA58_020150 [Flavobacterium jejuense]|uniref:Prepilin type IV endopeptidase peptidase domain-containing protein n=1 Tax=Flavobacterium jejuense TaxID=1544455 RepID=A0ABX0IWB8_9FLAO|nr:hypothetical protein [Flavobacterium jejuense]NHN27998.1 hypothetical protein [Flavobacterium jejuense]